jgi:UDP-N-acetylmuramoyl-tripeptide--D-alanyl-D-alanine ligase
MGKVAAVLASWVKSVAGALQRRRFDAQTRRASRMRDASSALRIGLTGSSGKSSTAGLLAHILRTQGRVAEQADSNLFGTLVKTLRKKAHLSDFVVAELGVAGVGQMQPMAEMLKPDVAIVTLVALEHYSHFRTHETVAEEKG